ncbi:ATP-binding protein [Streptomyces sp. 6N223]|uniref:ATP-binding protein n=1 Tax=Streptomyces sp. 6N223 TaxID=3457412 RepID=UPI003FD4B86E
MSSAHGTTPLPLPRPARSPAHPPAERFTLPAQADSVAIARRIVARWLRVWGVPEEPRETARLVVSELFTNAVLHTDSGQVVCRIEASGGRLRLEVADQGLGLDETPEECGIPGKAEDVEAENGRGLMLVDALTESWGVITADRRAGCTVWAEIEAEYEPEYGSQYPAY